MIASYFITAIRSFRRHVATTTINLTGLALGLAAFMLIMIMVRQELTFDRFHENADQIYRINKLQSLDGVDPEHVAITSGMVAPTIRSEFPEIENAVRALRWFDPFPISAGETVLKIDDVLFTDNSFFEVFSFHLLSGDPGTVLVEPQSVVLTPDLAIQLFGDDDVVGKTLVGLNDHVYTVTGIVEPSPVNSHLKYRALISWSSTVPGEGALQFGWANRWMTSSMYTFVQLSAGSDAAQFAAKLPAFLERHYPEGAEQYTLYPQALTDIHLESSHILYQDGADLGNKRYVYVFLISALLILLIAAINFINVKTAVADDRSREVGVRKALGAARLQLQHQFLGESVLLALIAGVVAIGLVELFLPLAGDLVGKRPQEGFLERPSAAAGTLVVAFIVGVLAGLYPAVVLSRFRPVAVLRGSGGSGVKYSGATLRRLLVGTQFAISTVLVGGSAVVIEQTDFMRNLDVGVDKDQVLTIPTSDSAIQDQYDAFKQEVLTIPGVSHVTGSDWVPGEPGATYGILPEGRSEHENWIVQMVQLADFDFADTYGIEMAAGRFFDDGHVTDSAHGVVINETLARALGWSMASAVGKRLDIPGDVDDGRVIGVMRDFNLRSAQYAITPVVLVGRPRYGNVSVKISPQNVDQTLVDLEAVWSAFEPRYPFEYRFVDETFASMYDSQAQLGRVLTVFSGLAVLVACLGLFGLASLLARKRTKEIGVRKTLGASVASVFGLLTGEIVRLVLVATVIAVPVAYLLSSRWLDGFTYRIDPSPATFFLVAVGLMTVGLLAVGYQSIRAALADPVDALRYE